MKQEIFSLCQRHAEQFPLSPVGQELRDVLAEPQPSEVDVAIVLMDTRGNDAEVTSARNILRLLGVGADDPNR